MNRIVTPFVALAAAVALAGCVIDAGSDGWENGTSLAERTRLAREACGEGNVAEVTANGFECKTDAPQ